MGKRKKVSLEEKASLVEPLGLATDAGSSASGRSRVLYHGELDQLVSLGGISALEENGNQPMRRSASSVAMQLHCILIKIFIKKKISISMCRKARCLRTALPPG